MKKSIALLTTIMLSLIWFVSVFIAFAVPEIEWNYRNPRIQVQLKETLIGVNGISDSDSLDLKWTIVENVFAVGRKNGIIEFSDDNQAFVVVDETVLKDTYNEQHVLSKEEVVELFEELCEGKVTDFQIEGLDYTLFEILPSELFVKVNGRYEGRIALTTNKVISESDTDIDVAWKATDHLPLVNIAECIGSAIVLSVIVYMVLSKSERYKIVIPVLCSALIVLVLIAFYLASKMK